MLPTVLSSRLGGRRRRPVRIRALWGAVLAGLLMVLSGCPRSGSDGTEPGREAFPPDAKLRVLVVGDPALATAVEQLRGQWKLQTGTSFEVYEKPDLDSAAANPPEAGALIAASPYLGALAERKWIVPVPQGLT